LDNSERLAAVKPDQDLSRVDVLGRSGLIRYRCISAVSPQAARQARHSAKEFSMARADKQASTAAAEEAAELLASAFRQELDLTDQNVQRDLRKASRLVQDWTAGLADEAAERTAAERHTQAAAKQYERATAGVAKPNPIVVTVGRVRATVERIADLPLELPKK
jgi:erythromycin esterase-like protein